MKQYYDKFANMYFLGIQGSSINQDEQVTKHQMQEINIVMLLSLGDHEILLILEACKY